MEEALKILRQIVADGYLSDTQMHRAQRLIQKIDHKGIDLNDLNALAEECRKAIRLGAVSALQVKRYREAANCSLAHAYNKVVKEQSDSAIVLEECKAAVADGASLAFHIGVYANFARVSVTEAKEALTGESAA